MISKNSIEHNGKKIIYSQLENSFLITTDSILLSNFIRIKQKDKIIIDIGTGQGLIPILLSTRTSLKIYGVEIQKELSSVAINNVHENNLEKHIEIINDKIQNYDKYFMLHSVDIIVSNPPYFKVIDNFKANDSLTKTISRHETKLTFDELAYCCSKLLRHKGHFYFIHRTERLVEIIETLKKYKLEPKRLQFIYTNSLKDAPLFLLDAVYCGKEEIKVETPIFLESE